MISWRIVKLRDYIGHDFKGWYTTRFFEGDTVAAISAKDRGDKTFYAKWQVKVFRVTAESNNDKWGMVTGLRDGGKYDYGTNITLTAVAGQGYELAYWGDDVENNSTEIRFMVTGDTSIVANFRAIDPESSSSSVTLKSSSSDAKSSSSEEKSSSSSKCEGKECKDAIPAIASVPSFRVMAAGRELQVSGARVGASLVLLDLQGRVLRKFRVESVNFAFPVEHAGGYLVRIGNDVRRISIR